MLETFKDDLNLSQGIDDESLARLCEKSKNKIARDEFVSLVKDTFKMIEKFKIIYRKKQIEIQEQANKDLQKVASKKWYE